MKPSYEELEARCAALAAEVQAVRWAAGQVYSAGYNHGHLNTADELPYASDEELLQRGNEVLAWLQNMRQLPGSFRAHDKAA